MKKIAALLILIGLLNLEYAVQGAATQDINANTLKNRVVSVPAGNTFKGVFLAPVSSDSAYNGQEVSVALSNDFYYKNRLIAPAGSTVTGTVIDVSRARHGSVDGKLSLRFTHILTPSGNDIPISAIVKTTDDSGIIIGNKKWDFLTERERNLTGNDTSIVLRNTSAVHVNSVVRGNTTMPALGSGGGLVKSIWDKGSEVYIPVSTSMDFILIQPITLNPLVVEN